MAEGADSLLIVTDGELQVTRNDTLLLVVASGVTSQLENFGGEVLEDSREVDWYPSESEHLICFLQCFDSPGAPAPTRWA